MLVFIIVMRGMLFFQSCDIVPRQNNAIDLSLSLSDKRVDIESASKKSGWKSQRVKRDAMIGPTVGVRCQDRACHNKIESVHTSKSSTDG